jgi:predicted esterase
MSASVIAELEAGPRTREAVDAWMARHKFPVVIGPSITFVWRGDAEAVHLKHWVFGLPSSQSLARVPDTDVWHLTMQLPLGSRVEYKLEVVRHGHGEWIQDPLNPNLARDPFGANSVAHGTGYEGASVDPPRPDRAARPVRRDLARLAGLRPAQLRALRPGPVQAHPALSALGRPRRPRLPALRRDGHDPRQPDRSARGRRRDRGVHQLADRLREYADDERHARYLTEELVPFVERTFPLEAVPQGRCLMGASFGAVAALSTACRYPGFFGRLLLQSGSFAFTDIGDRNHRGPLFDPVVAFMNRFRAEPTAVAERVFVSCGMYESLIYENRSLVPMLLGTGMDVRYVEARDGHNWENWRDRLREALSWLMPGPFLLVYE